MFLPHLRSRPAFWCWSLAMHMLSAKRSAFLGALHRCWWYCILKMYLPCLGSNAEVCFAVLLSCRSNKHGSWWFCLWKVLAFKRTSGWKSLLHPGAWVHALVQSWVVSRFSLTSPTSQPHSAFCVLVVFTSPLSVAAGHCCGFELWKQCVVLGFPADLESVHAFLQTRSL